MSNAALKSPWPADPLEQVRALRRERGETGAQFGALIGLAASKVSEIENGKYVPTPDVALAIEALSGGRIDAARLNELVARARGEQPFVLRQAQDELRASGEESARDERDPVHASNSTEKGAQDHG